MNAEIALASVLRSVSSSIAELPQGFVADVLDGVADGLESSQHACHIHLHASEGDAPASEGDAPATASEAPATSEAPVAPVAAAPVVVPTTAAPEADAGDEYEDVEGELQAGDEWKLRDGLRHSDRRPVMWRTITEDLVGRDSEDFDKSVFRRKVTKSTEAAEDFDYPTEGVVAAGDEWKLRDGLRHSDRRPVIWREVGADLVGKEISSFEKSVFRRRK